MGEKYLLIVHDLDQDPAFVCGRGHLQMPAPPPHDPDKRLPDDAVEMVSFDCEAFGRETVAVTGARSDAASAAIQRFRAIRDL